MAESSNQEKQSAKQKKHKETSGLVYGGSILTGIGIGFATGSLVAGVLIGIGVALLIVAALRHKLSD